MEERKRAALLAVERHDRVARAYGHDAASACRSCMFTLAPRRQRLADSCITTLGARDKNYFIRTVHRDVRTRMSLGLRVRAFLQLAIAGAPTPWFAASCSV